MMVMPIPARNAITYIHQSFVISLCGALDAATPACARSAEAVACKADYQRSGKNAGHYGQSNEYRTPSYAAWRAG